MARHGRRGERRPVGCHRLDRRRRAHRPIAPERRRFSATRSPGPGSHSASADSDPAVRRAWVMKRTRDWWGGSWPSWSALGAAVWSAVYGCLGLWWISHPAGFPFGVGPSAGPASSLWAGLRPEAGARVVAVLGFTGAVVAILMVRMRPRGGARAALLAFSWVMTATLLVLVPDGRALATAAYAPLFLLGAPFGWPPVSYWDAVPWPVWYQFGCIV